MGEGVEEGFELFLELGGVGLVGVVGLDEGLTVVVEGRGFAGGTLRDNV